MEGWAMNDSKTNQIKYNIHCTWEDRIDANFSVGWSEYLMFSLGWLISFGRCKNYDVIIK